MSPASEPSSRPASSSPLGPQPTPSPRVWIVTALILTVLVTLLRLEGRRWWCACGQLNPWAGDIWSSHNSQHLFDPYSFTHLLHGVVYCGALTWALPRLSIYGRFQFAVAIESCWEVVENSLLVIQRYRSETMALNYQGDTSSTRWGTS